MKQKIKWIALAALLVSIVVAAPGGGLYRPEFFGGRTAELYSVFDLAPGRLHPPAEPHGGRPEIPGRLLAYGTNQGRPDGTTKENRKGGITPWLGKLSRA